MFLRQLTRADCMKKCFIYKCIYNRWVRRKAYSFWDIFFYKWLYKIHVSQTFGTWLLTQHRWENVYTTWKWHKLKMFQSTHVYFTLLNDGCVRFLRIFSKISVSVVYNISHIPSRTFLTNQCSQCTDSVGINVLCWRCTTTHRGSMYTVCTSVEYIWNVTFFAAKWLKSAVL